MRSHPGTLPYIIDEFSIQFYGSIETLCDNIARYIHRFEDKELFLEHINYSVYLTAEIKDFIGERRLIYIPYLHELSEKSTTGHDCANCSGRCDMQHTLKLVEFTTSLNKMRNTSNYIQRELLALKRFKDNNVGTLQWLENEIRLLTNILEELFVHEEQTLIPAMQYAQKNINADS